MDLDCDRQWKFRAPLPPLVAHKLLLIYGIYLILVTPPYISPFSYFY